VLGILHDGRGRIRGGERQIVNDSFEMRHVTIGGDQSAQLRAQAARVPELERQLVEAEDYRRQWRVKAIETEMGLANLKVFSREMADALLSIELCAGEKEVRQVARKALAKWDAQGDRK
jgi:hypothetical protein